MKPNHIPGVPKIGAKTATAILHEYSGLNEIYENLENIRQRKHLIAGKDSYVLSKWLAQIRTDVPWDSDLETLKVNGIKEDLLIEKLQRFGFFKIIDQMGLKPKSKVPEVDIKILTEASQFDAMLDQVGSSSISMFAYEDQESAALSVVSMSESDCFSVSFIQLEKSFHVNQNQKFL